MGSRSAARARAQVNASAGNAGPPGQVRPASITFAALVQGAQATAILVAALLAGLATIHGKSYQNASGIAITAIGAATAVTLGLVAFGLFKVRRWSRTPALMTQLFTGIIGIYLVQGARYEWGVPALVLAVAGFALLLAPPSWRALTFADR